MAFLTIAIAPGLSKRQHRRAARIGPRSVASNRSPRELMEAAGYERLEVVDVTEDFRRTAVAWHEQYTKHADELRSILGSELDELCENRTDLIAGVEEGLLQRALVSGTKA